MKRFYDAVLTKLNLAYFFFLLIQPLCSAKISHEVGHNYCNKRAQNRLFTLLKPSCLCEPTALEKILVMGRGISLKARIEPSVTEYQEQHEQSYFTIPLCYHKLLQKSYYSYYGWSVHRGERRGVCLCVPYLAQNDLRGQVFRGPTQGPGSTLHSLREPKIRDL